MSSCCAGPCASDSGVSPRFRKALWIALVVNAAMLLVEIAGSLSSGSVSLLADAVDFGGDAANYALSLAVLSLGWRWRSRAALVKGWSMGLYGAFVLGKAAWAANAGASPEPTTMAGIGVLALVANVSVALLLYAFRSGDANMRSVWLCSRNDAIVNVMIVIAAAGVFGTGSAWPDLIVAAAVAMLALWSSLSVVRHASAELRSAPAKTAHAH